MFHRETGSFTTQIWRCDIFNFQICIKWRLPHDSFQTDGWKRGLSGTPFVQCPLIFSSFPYNRLSLGAFGSDFVGLCLQRSCSQICSIEVSSIFIPRILKFRYSLSGSSYDSRNKGFKFQRKYCRALNRNRSDMAGEQLRQTFQHGTNITSLSTSAECDWLFPRTGQCCGLLNVRDITILLIRWGQLVTASGLGWNKKIYCSEVIKLKKRPSNLFGLFVWLCIKLNCYAVYLHVITIIWLTNYETIWLSK
jgi:hypothetical protein